MSGTATQRLQIFTSKSDSQRTSQTMYEAAKGFDLTVDALTGNRGPLGYRLNVTLTGAPEQIEAFHRKFQGDGWYGSGGSDIAGFILSPVLAAIFGASQRSVASRLRQKKLERQATKDDPPLRGR